MTTATFAGWVEPVASQMRESRQQVLDFARCAPPEIWGRPSAVEGWTNQDLLAHIGGGNDQLLQQILRAVVAGEAVDPAVLALNTDAENARAVAERTHWSLDRVIEELEAGGAAMQRLLGSLSQAHRELKPGGAPWTLGRLFDLVHGENHDIEHLEQLRLAYAPPAAHAFVAWVEPIARRLRASRAEIARYARSVPVSAWGAPSPNPRWSNRDLIAHLATGHWFLQENLRRITEGGAFVPSFKWPEDPNVDIVDWGNWERANERRDWPVERVTDEVEPAGQKTQELLARLSEEHEHRGPPGRTMGQNLTQFPNHEYFHLAQLREGVRTASALAGAKD